ALTKKFTLKGVTVVANNVVVTRTIGRLPIVTDREIVEGPVVHLAQSPIVLGNPTAIASEVDVYQDVLAKLRKGNLYWYYGERRLTYPSVPAQMYPITVTEVGQGAVKGRERL